MEKRSGRYPIVLGSILLFALLGCGERQQGLRIGDRFYIIPPAHIVSQEQEPHTFLRVKHPDVPFALVYDSRSEVERDELGLARIFGVNEENAPGIEYYRTDERVVVCRRAVHPKSGCGAKVNYGGANWSIVFPIARKQEVEQFVPQASALLKHYEAARR